MGRRKRVELKDALVLVTGAGSGIGRATALAFAQQGSRVLCVDIDLQSAEKTAVECQEIGPEAWAFEADVSDRAAMAALADTVHDTHGPLDVLVNNAGVGMSAPFLDTTAEDWDWILGINLRGVINGCEVFGAPMVRRGSGHVVNVASGLGYVPTATEVSYGTTKAAVLHFSRCLRADWRRHGVGVTAICPGVINTPIVRHTRYRGESARPTNRARVERMFSRLGHKPELVAKAIVSSVRKDQPVVPVGFESWLGWFGHHVLPSRVTDVMGAARSKVT
jgi:NAD(P)-dependent dehydrogenase (short-subunit alcohol dehydrogenase family)